MELNLELKLKTIYGGDGIKRPYQVEEVKLSRTKTRTRTTEALGIPSARETTEEEKELKDDACFTFKQDEDGTSILRLGGVHGKTWGHLKECAQTLKDSKGLFGSFAEIERFMRTTRISPIYVRLENANGGFVDQIFQMMAGRKSTGVPQYFDVIGECKANITIVCPDTHKTKLMEMLKIMPSVPFGNKRRGIAEVINLPS